MTQNTKRILFVGIVIIVIIVIAAVLPNNKTDKMAVEPETTTTTLSQMDDLSISSEDPLSNPAIMNLPETQTTENNDTRKMLPLAVHSEKDQGNYYLDDSNSRNFIFEDEAFYLSGNKILDVKTIPGIEGDKVNLLGKYDVNNMSYFAVKAKNKIILLSYENNEFTGYYPIATTAVETGEDISISKDRTIYNESALMVDNVIFYRTADSKIVKLEITENKVINESTVASNGEILVLDLPQILMTTKDKLLENPNLLVVEFATRLY